MKHVSLQEVASVVRGVSFGKNDVVESPSNGFVPILRAGNIEGDLNVVDDLVWVPEFRVSAEQHMRTSDIAICMSSGSQSVVGKTATLEHDWRGSVGAFCAIIRPDTNQIEPDFLALFLKSETFRSWTRQSSGANIKNIRKTELESFKIPLPTREEQCRIVDLLSRAEGIVRLRREAQRKAAELVPALFLDMFGDPASNPKGWSVTALGEVADVQGGLQVTKARASHPIERTYLRVANVYRGHLDLRELKTIRLTEAELTRTRLQRGDLLFVEGHGNAKEVGRVAVWDGSIEDCTHQNHLIRARPKPNQLESSFAAALLNSASGRLELTGRAKTTSGLSTISTNAVRSVQLMLPPLTLQRQFAAKVDAVRGIAAQQATALATAQATFDALLHQSFQH